MRRSVRAYADQSKELLIEKATNFWRRNQFSLTHPGPFQMHGEQYYAQIGLRRVVDISMCDQGNDVSIDLSFSATLGNTEAMIGVVGAIVFLPLTALVAAVSYLDYEKNADQLINDFWNYMGPYSGNPESQPKQVATCFSCGTALDLNSKFCKNCGVKIESQPP